MMYKPKSAVANVDADETANRLTTMVEEVVESKPKQEPVAFVEKETAAAAKMEEPVA